MNIILIGHRGVGKTSLLNRLKTYFANKSDYSFFDLDSEIEKKYQKPITDLFPEVGENKFREIEFIELNELQKKSNKYIISVGAGFNLEKLENNNLKIIWIRRKTDELGRIFLNRPRLNKNVSALDEYKERFPQRQLNYATAADEVYWLPEGLDSANKTEQKIWNFDTYLNAGGTLTLLPFHFKTQSFLRYECLFYEFRDDLISINQKLWLNIDKKNRLLSFRDKANITNSLAYLNEFSESDWAVELGPCPDPRITIISAHVRNDNESLKDFLLRLENSALPKQHLKASPIIYNYTEAEHLLSWQKLDPQNRSILPRSTEENKGQWVWLRLFLKSKQKINFWKDSDGSAYDQPTLFEWLNTNDQPNHFAALLGNPVLHSKTMIEQNSYFANKSCPVWPILISPDDFHTAFSMLIKHGLIAAAVTSPLKKLAFEACTKKSETANKLNSVNTIHIKNNEITGHNTDIDGFKKLVEVAANKLNINLTNLTAVVYGGGGTLPVIESILPNAIQISLRSQSTRKLDQIRPKFVNIFIWAASPDDSAPNFQIDFDCILDLNYREDSLAKQYALDKNKLYISGDIMFKYQAQEQRHFWDQF